MKTHTPRLLISCLCGLMALVMTTSADPLPKAGDKAPLVTGRDQDGSKWKLEKAIKKNNVLLYFYPKDFTGGCTKEACAYRDRLTDFQNADVKVVGVSFDSEQSHKDFIAQHKLNFTLLADTDGKIAEAYGVRVAGKNLARRVSFLIGKDGKIVHVTNAPNPDMHIKEMKEAIAGLKK